MSDNEKEDQSGRSKSAKSKNRNQDFKSKLRGNIAELGPNIYGYGHREQVDQYINTTEAIAAYVGREYGKAMGYLVKNKEEMKPEEPRVPSTKATEASVRRYDKELD